jgi:hypothetical protein
MTSRLQKVRNLVAPNLPVAPNQYERRYQDQLTNVLRLFFNLVSNSFNAPKPHGSFYDTTTQTNPVPGAVNLMKFDSVYNSGETQFSVNKDTNRVYVAETAVYNIQFSAQLDKTGGGASDVFIWLRLNGNNVAHSATKMVVDGPNNELVAAWNWVITLADGDYIELAWQSPDANVILLAAPASGNIPQIPSVILTVTWVSNVST